MAATLAVKIVTDARQAQGGIDDVAQSLDKIDSNARGASSSLDGATSAVKDYGRAADSAGRAGRDVAGGIDTAGSASQRTAGGIRDLAGALEGTRFGGVAQGAVAASTYFEAAAGAGDLFSAAVDYLSLANVKSAAAMVKNTAATVANKVATMAASVASKAWAIAQAALNVVLSANPIGIIIIAVVALVAAIVLAYKNSETFRKIVQTVFKAVADYIMIVVNIVKVVLVGAWNVLKVAVGVAIAIVKGYITTWITIITTVINLIKVVLVGAWNTMKSVASTVLDALMAPLRAVRDAIQWVIDKVQDLLGFISDIHLPSLPDWIPFVGSNAVTVTGGGLVSATRVGLPARAGRAAPATRSGGGVVVNLSVPPTANPVEVGRQIVATIRRFERAAGAGWRNGTVVP